jgi:CHAT domain-containing protein
VLAPVAARLQGRQHLIVAANGALAQLPLAMLPEGEGADPSWLVRRLAVSQVPSLSAWLSLRQGQAQRSAPLPLLAWADPSFGSTQPAAATLRGEPAYESLTPLPESRDEVLAVARALKANPERDVLAGQKATRDSVLDANRSGRLGQARVVMFATHGLRAGELPGVQQPGLALSAVPGPADPGRFVVGLDDVLGLRLNADWVVLSACNTAGGDGRAEEALSGLARGFLYAGARSLLVTHWAVETESARQLTTRLFEHQAAQPQSARAESLRQAMLALMAQPAYAHPAFWAPFALVGEGLK